MSSVRLKGKLTCSAACGRIDSSSCSSLGGAASALQLREEGFPAQFVMRVWAESHLKCCMPAGGLQQLLVAGRRRAVGPAAR